MKHEIRVNEPNSFSVTVLNQPLKDNTKQYSVLVVEDDPLMLDCLTILLGESQYNVLTATSDEAAIAYLKDPSQSIDLMFSDIRLKGSASGIELAQMATSLRSDMKILLTTGFELEFLENNPGDNFHIIQKPYLPSELLTKIDSILTIPTAA